MVWFDQKLQKILVRLVYDGPAHAGKTTNVTQLAAAFTTLRRGELLVPEEKDGRTLYFDWLHLDGGVIAGHGLRCQLLTVPGQSLLAQRRWHLVETADVLVFVCDSGPAGVREAKRSFEILRARYCDETPRAIVVQANKQDAPDALTPEQIAAELELDSGIPVVAARAIAGVGVRETAVVAIRAAADIAQRLVLTKGIDALKQPDDGPEALLATLKPLAQTRGRRRSRAGRTWMPVALHPEIGLPLPHAGIPTGYVWPAARGRDTLEAIESACASAQIAQVESRMRSGDRRSFRIAKFEIETASAPFSTPEQALSALLALAQKKVRLGQLCPEETTLAIVASEERFWLWSIGPALPTFEERLATTPRERTVEALGKALAESLRIAFTHSISLTADPALLAAADVGFVYYGDVELGVASLETTVESMLDGLVGIQPTSAEHLRLSGALWLALQDDAALMAAVRREIERCAKADATDRSRMANRLLEHSTISPLD
ncbi:hypothetical protein LZC95_33380 [Pendulispora brunnea]|uniref:Uncharacterized protein n=1 Tax=Pendulispora brunnea TaxID=2905690 RepID=A0ABZ2JXZ6_9BACT